ncbi:MAG: DNA polymerase III subunit delta [Firmicutes bacterium ADurb.Bin300]|nr:MAG: DNA polymerase III subunit delta [Firmicutes bacterium ADurb.Bin300]
MSKLNEEGLKKQIREKKFDRLYLLYGTEDFLKQHYASLIPQKIIKPDFEAFNLHKLDGKSTSLEEIADCVSFLPLSGEYSCTVVYDMLLSDLIPDRTARQNDEEVPEETQESPKDFGQKFDTFLEIISDIPEGSVLIFWLDTIRVDEKNFKWRKIISAFDKYGSAVNLSSRSLSNLVKLLCETAAKKGCALDRADASYMVNIVGDDMGTLKNELEKLCLYREGGKLSRADIENTVIFSAQANVFTLADLIIRGKADEAFALLSLLLKQKGEPIQILATLVITYVDMYRVKAAIHSGLKYSDVAEYFKDYKGTKMFRLEKAASLSKKYSLAQLRYAISLLSEADIKLKSTRIEGKTILELLIINLLRIS